MEKLKKLYNEFNYKGIIAITLIFALISVMLFMERSGIKFNYDKKLIDFLPDNKIITKASACANLDKTTLVLHNSNEQDSINALTQFKVIFSDMKVGYDLYDVSKDDSYDYNKYECVVILISDLTPMGEKMFTMCDWVKNGGNVMFAVTLAKNGFSASIDNKLGIIDSSGELSVADNIYIEKDFMIGGGNTFEISDPYDSSLSVQLDYDLVKVHAYTDNDVKLPLIWERKYGSGKFVIYNLGIIEKSTRGFLASSYSLMTDVSVYPVINGSVFYLDDFPSQIPSGINEYIMRDYGTSIRDFYVNIWWPSMMNFSDKYGIRYTGLAIKCYDDNIDGTVTGMGDKGTFLNFGNMLLRQGGELGYHGYNHQPLCFGNCDYKGLYDYKTWKDYGSMKTAFDDLISFCDDLFPDVKMEIYVPPSNILSKEGREFLLKEYPHIKTISGIYFEEADFEYSCVQEYDVSQKGVVDQPRIISGCDLDDFMKLAAVSELNLHYINNHFTHPDDALDSERGAEKGWEYLKNAFDSYLEWLYTSAPGIRNLTGSEMSSAIQRYVAVAPHKKMHNDKMVITLDNFYDEAYLMVRFNEKKPISVDGGELTLIDGDMYILKANKDTVTVNVK